MRSASKYSLPVGFIVSLLGVGIPYWIIPYAGVSLPDSLMKPTLLIVIGAAALAHFSAVSFRKSVVYIGASVPAAVLVRVVVDTAADPTSHNLWPFEVVIAAFVGSMAALAGATLAALLRKLRRAEITS